MNSNDESEFLSDLDERIDFCEEVDTYLSGANVEQRKVILSDGAELSIDEAADRIAQVTKLDRDEVLGRVVNWLMMDYVPAGLTDGEMAAFETKMESWTASYE